MLGLFRLPSSVDCTGGNPQAMWRQSWYPWSVISRQHKWWTRQPSSSIQEPDFWFWFCMFNWVILSILSRSTSWSLNFLHPIRQFKKCLLWQRLQLPSKIHLSLLPEHKARRQFQISLEVHMVMWLSSRQQNVSTSVACKPVFTRSRPFTSRLEWQGLEQTQKWLIQGSRAAVSLGP